MWLNHQFITIPAANLFDKSFYMDYSKIIKVVVGPFAWPF